MSLSPLAPTVLIVDNEPDLLHMLIAAMERAELTSLVATSGRAAIDMLDHILPEIIVMDAVMPGMDGFETTQRIKARPEMANVPVIFMTGLHEAEHVVEAFEVGGTDYVRKPVNASELIARIRVHLAQSRAMQASLASLDATGRMMLATTAQGGLLWCTPRAEAVIGAVEVGWRCAEQGLPAALAGPIERLLARGIKVGASVRIDVEEGVLELMVAAHYRENEVLIRLNEINHNQHAARLRDRFELTQREAEVLLWVGYGKGNSDISEALEISPRTVQKHLERIFVKLGVEKRSAAAALAVRAIAQ